MTTTKTTARRAGLDRIGRVVQGRPELAERTAAMLRGDLPCPGLEADGMGMAYVPLRLPAELVARADALVPRLVNDPRMVAVGRPVRSTVMRLALVLGLQQLERDAEQAGTSPAPATGGKAKRHG